SDLPRLVELEGRCWPAGMRVSEEVIKGRLISYPIGQFVIESDGAVWGVIYSQRISSAEKLSSVRFDTAGELHQVDGAIIHVLSLNIHPEKQNLGFGDELLEHLLTYCHDNGIAKTVVGVTRCKDYKKYSGIKLEEYIKKTNNQGRCVDTILRLHQLHGARIKSLVPRVRPADLVNH